MIRVVVADDQPLVRAGLRKILEVDPDVTVVAEAEDGLGAVAAVERTVPDVAVVDVRMPNVDGIEATRRITGRGAGTRVLILTTFGLDEYVLEAVRAGASGFLLKDAPPERLIEGVKIVAAGDSLLDPQVTRAVIEQVAAQRPPDADSQRRLADLTARESEVLVLMTRGLSNREIAERLVVSEGTAKTHVLRVLRKLGLRDRVHAVIFGYETGLARVGEPGSMPWEADR